MAIVAQLRRGHSSGQTSSPVASPTASAAATPAGAPASAAVAPAAFTIDYRTGSIPPPYNYAYRLTGRFEDAQLAVSYVLTYRYRDGMTRARLESEGYSDRDDLSWTGAITGEALAQWRVILRDTQLRPPPTGLIGGDSFTVSIVDSAGGEHSGEPPNRGAWQVLIAAIDQQARREAGNPRPRP